MRRTLAPVLAVACFRCAALRGALVAAARRARLRASLDVAVWLLALARAAAGGRVPGRPRALAAVHRRRDAAARGAAPRATPRPSDLRAALADAFDDPVARDRLLARTTATGTGPTRDGRRCEPPRPRPGRCLTEIRDGDRRVAAIVHDAGAARRPRVHRRRDVVRADDARQPPALGAGGRAAARGARVARAHPGRRPTTSAGGSSATCTTARSSGSSRCGSSSSSRPSAPATATRTRDGAGCSAARRRRSRRRSTRSARSRAGSTRRRSPTAASSRRCARRRCAARCRRPCSPPASAATRARSRARRTSAAWRRSRTPPSTRTGATAAVIDLSDDGALRFEVRDDGAGFDPRAVDGGRRASRACATGSPRSAASWRSRRGPGTGRASSRAIPLNGGF